MTSANARPRVLPFSAAVSPQPNQIKAEAVAPYAPRIVRAVAVLVGAVSVHVWGVPSPHPQPMPLAAFASRMMRLPAVPLAPSVPRRAAPLPVVLEGRVTVENKLVRVSPSPPRAIPPRTLRTEQLAVPVGTSGRFAQASPPEPSPAPGPLSAAPVVNSSAAAVVPASPEPSGRAVAAGDPGASASSAPPRPAPAARLAESRRPSGPSSPSDDGTAEKERAQKDTEVVLALLQEYSRAYERMDVRATKAVYPSVDDRRLRRAFDDLQGQQVRFASCGVTISSTGAGANAWCKGDASYRPKVGSPRHYSNREWTFSLARDGGGWQILKATMQ
jgi:hypothetical protein